LGLSLAGDFLMKYFEISIKKNRSETILVPDTDSPETWWRANVAFNRNSKITLNGTTYPTGSLVSAKEIGPVIWIFP
jgi:hypothetical protein